MFCGRSLRDCADYMKENASELCNGYAFNGSTYPSVSTIARVFRNSAKVKIKPRPFVKPEHMARRVDFSLDYCCPVRGLTAEEKAQTAEYLQTNVDVDESWIVFHPGTGVIRCENYEDLAKMEEQVYPGDRFKKSPPKILVIAGVTAPRLLNPETCDTDGAEFDEKQRGVVFLARFASAKPVLRASKKHAAGSTKIVSTTCSGATYEYLMTGPHGLVTYMDKYYASDRELDDGIRVCDRPIPYGITTEYKTNEAERASAQMTARLAALPQDAPVQRTPEQIAEVAIYSAG